MNDSINNQLSDNDINKKRDLENLLEKKFNLAKKLEENENLFSKNHLSQIEENGSNENQNDSSDEYTFEIPTRDEFTKTSKHHGTKLNSNETNEEIFQKIEESELKMLTVIKKNLKIKFL